jgi:hypothetical protein
MKQNVDTDPDQTQDTGPAPQPNTTPGRSGNKHMIRYVILAMVIIVVIALVLLPSASYPTITQNKSENSTPLYMSVSQVQTLLNSPLANYSTSDLYNPASLINMSDLVSSVPQLYGNATSGWLTTAGGSNSTSNLSIEYFVITTSNTSIMAKLLGSSIVSSLNMSPTTVSSGMQNGLNYTYGVYQNSTVSFQTLYGWKHSNIVVALLQENPGFLVNETKLIGIASNDT